MIDYLEIINDILYVKEDCNDVYDIFYNNIIDVTEIYLKNATPGIGKITIDKTINKKQVRMKSI